MSTVYRNLNILLEQGLVQKIDFGSTFDRFEATIEPHYHFVCTSCDAIIDLSIPFQADLDEKVRALTGFSPVRHRTEFFGFCPACLENISTLAGNKN